MGFPPWQIHPTTGVGFPSWNTWDISLCVCLCVKAVPRSSFLGGSSSLWWKSQNVFSVNGLRNHIVTPLITDHQPPIIDQLKPMISSIPDVSSALVWLSRCHWHPLTSTDHGFDNTHCLKKARSDSCRVRANISCDLNLALFLQIMLQKWKKCWKMMM